MAGSSPASSDGQRDRAGSGGGSSSSVDDDARTRRRRRLQFAGVTVSPDGFRAVLRLNETHCCLPPPVSDDPLDRSAASSPQALTLLQLLAGVDMAGPVLPPDALARIAVLSLEEEQERQSLERNPEGERGELQPAALTVLKLVRDRVLKLESSAGTAATSYSDLSDSPWLRSRVSLPVVTLDELQLPSGTLVCEVKSVGTIAVCLTESVVEQVAYQYRPGGVSRTFAALALALRYRAPVVLVEEGEEENDELGDDNGGYGDAPLSCPLVPLQEVIERYPQYRTTGQLAQTARRVTTNIETGLKVNQLQAALRRALELEDFKAASKIRDALDELDSLQDLPTQPETDTDSMQ